MECTPLISAYMVLGPSLCSQHPILFWELPLGHPMQNWLNQGKGREGAVQQGATRGHMTLSEPVKSPLQIGISVWGNRGGKEEGNAHFQTPSMVPTGAAVEPPAMLTSLGNPFPTL